VSVKKHVDSYRQQRLTLPFLRYTVNCPTRTPADCPQTSCRHICSAEQPDLFGLCNRVWRVSPSASLTRQNVDRNGRDWI